MKSLSIRGKVMAVIMLACFTGAIASILVANHQIEALGRQSIVDKATAILSRMEASSRFVAQQGMFPSIEAEMVSKYPDGALSEADQKRVLMTVPVYSAIRVGIDGADKERYRFRVAAIEARRKESEATPEERRVIDRFAADPNLDHLVVDDSEKREVIVYRPVRLDKGVGCLACHGDPATSPFKNGKDILGFKMENFKDKHLRGVFAIAASTKAMDDTVQASTRLLAGFGTGSAVLGLLLAFGLLNGSLLKLSSSTNAVSRVGGDVATASSQLKAAALQLAASSQAQAAALQESAASLEEITGMVESNTRHSQESVRAVEGVVGFSEETQKSLKELAASMVEIRDSNQKVRQLASLMHEIGQKTEVIDEIAFQTKILAFNAAVEAERAGEHGRGFSVVATEIGNLSKMSAASAAEITKIVSSTVEQAEVIAQENTQRVARGESLTQKAEGRMAQVITSASEILQSSRQIMRASEEQTVGLKQISVSLDSLNSATQSTAATSEEASSSSEALDQSAHQLNGQVIQLTTIVQGRAS